jgi:hypothetical protein
MNQPKNRTNIWLDLYSDEKLQFNVPKSITEQRLWIKSQLPEFVIPEFDELAFTALKDDGIVEMYSQMIELNRPDARGNTHLPAWWLANMCSEKAAHSVREQGLGYITALGAWFSQIGCFAAIQQRIGRSPEEQEKFNWSEVSRTIRSSSMGWILFESVMTRKRPIDSMALCQLWGVDRKTLLGIYLKHEHQDVRQSVEDALDKSKQEMALILSAVSTSQAQVQSLWWKE